LSLVGVRESFFNFEGYVECLECFVVFSGLEVDDGDIVVRISCIDMVLPEGVGSDFKRLLVVLERCF
jgi:hypothetical protein